MGRNMFPLVVIDFEASALTLDSYPIEVGIARAEDRTLHITSWSALIAPAPTWDLGAQWDPDAQRVHGIRPWQLRQAPNARDVMLDLNRRVGTAGTVWCDGAMYDMHWMRTLAVAAGIEPAFTLGDIANLLDQHPTAKDVFNRILAKSSAPHRAGPDAHRLCSALARALEG